MERKQHVGEHAATREISLSLFISFPFKAKSSGVNQVRLRFFSPRLEMEGCVWWWINYWRLQYYIIIN
jgi:hypothetical protein